MRYVVALWRARWAAARLTIAAVLLAAWMADHPSRLVRLQLGLLPDIDYAMEAAALRDAGRFADAELVLVAGIEAADEAQRPALIADLQETVAERNSVLRRAGEFAGGAVRGGGESLEALLGAITADLFVVGDVRDLVVQGSRWIAAEEVDELLVALSTVGVLTTVMPEFDAAASLLKVGKRAGAVSIRLGERLAKLAKRAMQSSDEIKPLREALADIATLARKTSPATALRTLKHLDDPADVARVARYLERNSDGGFALLITGEDGVRTLLRSGDEAAMAMRAAARKGRGGAKWLARAELRLFRPHIVVGALKAVHKGNLPKAVVSALEALDPHGWWILPGLAGWALFEISRVLSRFRGAQVSCGTSASGARSAPVAVCQS